MNNRGVAPVIAVILMVAMVVLLAGVAFVGFSGIVDDEIESASEPEVLLQDQCLGFETTEFEDMNSLNEEIQDNPCALWLQNGAWETTTVDGETLVTSWNDVGQNEFDATQSTTEDQPRVVYDSELDTEVVVFDGQNQDTSDPDGTDGEYLELSRNVDDLNLDSDDGLVVVSLVKVEEFQRGGTWTIGEAGQDGREFSMRTCSDFNVDRCQYTNPDGEWRAQHWGSSDVDFNSSDTVGEWAIMVHGYDGEEAFVRINGEEVAREPVDLDLSNNRDIQIARWERTPGDPDWYYNGRMAESFIFDEDIGTSSIESVEQTISNEYGIELND